MDKLFLIPVFLFLLIIAKLKYWDNVKYKYKYQYKGLHWYPIRNGKIRKDYEKLLRYTTCNVKQFFIIKYSITILFAVLFIAVLSTNNIVNLQKIGEFRLDVSDREPSKNLELYTAEEMRLYEAIKNKNEWNKSSKDLVGEISFNINLLGIESELTKNELIEKTIKRLEIQNISRWKIRDILDLIVYSLMVFFIPESYLLLVSKNTTAKVREEIFFGKQKYILLAAAKLKYIEIIKVLERESSSLKKLYREVISVYNENDIENKSGYKKLIKKYSKSNKDIELKIFLENVLLVGEESVDSVAENFLKMNQVESLKRDREVHKRITSISIIGMLGIFSMLFLIIYYGLKPFLQFITDFKI